jgi:hypothetical protein
MITFTRDEAQKLLDTLVEAIDAQQWELDNHIKTHGEWFRPKRVEYMKDALANTLRTVELLSHKLNTQPDEQIGITYEEANPPEPTIDGWPLYSGLPPIKVQDKSFEEFAQSFAQRPQPEPTGWVGYFEGRLVSFLQSQGQVNEFLQNTEPVGQVYPVYTNPQKKEWVGLTDDEMLMIYAQPHEGFKYSLGRMIQAKLKEKNNV